METLSPPGRHHGLWYVLMYCVLEGKEKKNRKKKTEKERERERKRYKFLIKSVIYLIFLLIRLIFFCSTIFTCRYFAISTYWFFVQYLKWLIFCYQHLLVCTFTILCNSVLCCLWHLLVFFCLLSALIGFVAILVCYLVLLPYSCIYWYLVILCLTGS
jgi:hypothetical protein